MQKAPTFCEPGPSVCASKGQGISWHEIRRDMGDLRDDCTVGLAFFLAFAAEVLVEHLVADSLDAAAPSMPRWWLIHVSLPVRRRLGGSSRSTSSLC